MNSFSIDSELLNQWQRHAKISFPALCQSRLADSHKGTYGTVGILGGQQGMSGAVILAGSSALKSGCGKVWLGFNQSTLPIAVVPFQPELMLSTATHLLERNDITVWVTGCGLGTDISAQKLLKESLQKLSSPMLLDADALNILARNPDIISSHQQSECLVLTPHPGEAGRLLQCSIKEIQSNRHQAVGRLAEQFAAWVVLKGHHTLVASPSGQIRQNLSGNPGLATAGSGDVLSGIIGSLLAQHIPPEQAICGGVWLHGIAAEILTQNQIGPIGLCANEIISAVRWLRNHLTD
ncbi:MAG: NAD(P)H-hydrate dehydratase [Snodgrassella sp.]|nr:NAD(P)H-hydrate dehydratase [Snodgrassella sp.]